MKSCVKIKLPSHMYLHYEQQTKLFLKLHSKKTDCAKLRLWAGL